MKRRAHLVLLLLALPACHKSAPTEDEGPSTAIPVTCEAARSGSAADTVVLRGAVAVPPDRDAMVAPQVPGRIKVLKVHEGDRVDAGDLLAVIDDPSLSTGVDEADAAATAAKAKLDNAEAALARARRLFEQGIAPRRDLEDAIAAEAAAAADSRAAAARHNLATSQRDRAHVHSPIAGVVVRLIRRQGELVDGTPATPIVEIADPVTLELRADAPAADLVRVPVGARGEIRLTALPDQALHGTVVYSSPAVDPTTSLGVVRATIDESPANVQLKLGLTGTLTISVGSRSNAVLVPASAIRRSSEGTQEVVSCADEHGVQTARVREVKVGRHVGDDAEITSGLAVGDKVVTRHVLGLEDGAHIQPAGAPAPPQPTKGTP